MSKRRDRRKFIKKSILGTSGFLLASNFISCAGDPEYTSHFQAPSFLAIKNFDAGVASFDPTDSQIILWTRYTTGMDFIKIVWQLATDADFTNIIRSGEVQTDASRDYTVAIQVQDLDPDLQFYYRFIQNDQQHVSVVGETRTFPTTGLDSLKIGLTSCSDYEAGYFNVYEAMANASLDLVLHVGDYIYEGRANGIGTGTLMHRVHEPNNELLTLDDYRTRYRQYRSDSSLQKLHQKKPCICVWDDHEIANDAYKDGAQNHQEGEGDFTERKQAALQAYSEYLPFTTTDTAISYRSFEFGNLAKLIVLDTRIAGRDKQLQLVDYQDEQGAVNTLALGQELANANRTLLGTTQKNWLLNEISSNTNTWTLLGQQVLLGKMNLPLELIMELDKLQRSYESNSTISETELTNFSLLLNQLVQLKLRIEANDPTLTALERSRVENTIPYNLDAWDGYPAEREQVLEALEGKKCIVLSGDSHNAWHNTLSKDNGDFVGHEFATAAVTSPGFERFVMDAQQMQNFQNAMVYLIEGLNYFDGEKKGYVAITLTHGTATSDWVSVASITEKPSNAQITNTTQV